jgi:hypothetical protein
VAAAAVASAAAAVASSAAASAPYAPYRFPANNAGLTARLRVSPHRALQLRGIMFDASKSTGPIVYYVFDYGDGVIETTTQPLMMHGYRKPGTYRATVSVIDASGNRATSWAVAIRVLDALPPTVTIASPRLGQHVVLHAGGVELKGTATDPNGVRSVQLAIELTNPPRKIKVPGGDCAWYDGKNYLVASACGSPYFFPAQYAGGRWHFTIPGKAQIPAGGYVVRVRATDRRGNVSSFYAVSLRTVIPFTLARR